MSKTKIIIGFFILIFSSCNKEKRNVISALGTTDSYAEQNESIYNGYNLDEILASGEIIGITLSGPSTYYEYRGEGQGTEFNLAQNFASSLGVKLRMETARDTASLFQALENGDADFIALGLKPDEVPSSFKVCLNEAYKMTRGWVVAEDQDALKNAIDRWYTPDRRKAVEAAIQEKFSPHRVYRHARAPFMNRAKGIISPYDHHFMRYSSAIGWDWRLMAAQCYQESAFDPNATSWAGARGLMQIMPSTADHLGLPHAHLSHPEKNIAASARFLNELNGKFSDVKARHERINYVLAAYNAGPGHVRDAMNLAKKYGKDPHRWMNVEPYILKLSEPQYYNDPVTKHGYMRGSETYNYVRLINQRWVQYRGGAKAVAPLLQGGAAARSGASASKQRKSRVLSAEELEKKWAPETSDAQE